jgi:hypothetical protein
MMQIPWLSLRVSVELGFLGFCLFHLSCGGGDVSIDRSQGIESAVNGVGGTGDNSLVYFTNTIFPLLIRGQTNAAQGCATPACHAKGSASNSAQTFFQINAASSGESWNWAQVRRNRVVEGTYASSGSQTLKSKKDANHNSFSDWSSDEKLKIDGWSALSQ